jgi:hypothetical protein
MEIIRQAVAKATKASHTVDYELRHTTTGEYAVEYPEVREALEALHELLPLLTPFTDAWEKIGSLANTDAIDGDQHSDHNDFVLGRSSMAHSVLQIMAHAEHVAVNQ